MKPRLHRMTSRNVLAGFAISALLAAACVKSKPEPAQTSNADSGVATSAPVALQQGSLAAPIPSSLAPAFASIAERFAFEAQNRPNGTPRAEDVFTAFEKSGTKFSEKSQHAAGVYGAKFCMGGKAEDDLHMSVCEFASPTEVATGKELSNKMFGTVPDRANYIRKNTLLILRQAVKTKASEARAKTIVEVFSAM